MSKFLFKVLYGEHNRIHLFMGAKGEVTYESQFETDEERPFELIEDLDIEEKELGSGFL